MMTLLEQNKKLTSAFEDIFKEKVPIHSSRKSRKENTPPTWFCCSHMDTKTIIHQVTSLHFWKEIITKLMQLLRTTKVAVKIKKTHSWGMQIKILTGVGCCKHKNQQKWNLHITASFFSWNCFHRLCIYWSLYSIFRTLNRPKKLKIHILTTSSMKKIPRKFK